MLNGWAVGNGKNASSWRHQPKSWGFSPIQ